MWSARPRKWRVPGRVASAARAVPTLWLFGGADRHVPVALAVRNLAHLDRPNFSWRGYAGCSHNLLLTGTGLDPADDAATRFGPGLFADIAAFIRRMGVAAPA